MQTTIATSSPERSSGPQEEGRRTPLPRASSRPRSTSTRCSSGRSRRPRALPGVDAALIGVDGAGRRADHRDARAVRRGGGADGDRTARRTATTGGAIEVVYRYRSTTPDAAAPVVRCGLVVPLASRRAAARHASRVFTRDAGRGALGRRRRRRARGARRARRPGDRERAPLPRGARSSPTSTRSPASTTAATSTRRSRARSRAPTATSAARADRLRPRRLQGRQRPDRPPRRRRGARRGRRSGVRDVVRTADIAVPRRRRRVRA